MGCITYAVDGVPLDDPAGRWGLRKGTLVGSGLSVRGVDSIIPGVDGSVAVGYEPLDVPSLMLTMSVYGRDYPDLMRNFGALLMLLAPTGPVTVTRTVDGVVVSQAARGKSTTDPEFHPKRKWLTFTATLRLPGVYWRGRAADWAGSGRVTTLDGSTAPISDALLLIEGPATNPRVSCGDQWVELDLTMADGERALVDCARWSVRVGSDVTFDGGGDIRSGALRTSGGPYLLRLVPRVRATDPTLTCVTVGVSDGSLAVRAAPAYLA